jgi:hypothetical protein
MNGVFGGNGLTVADLMNYNGVGFEPKVVGGDF